MRRNAQRSHDGQLVGCFAQEDDWQSDLGKQDADADVTSATVIRISTSPQETSREPRGLESVASRRESNGFERRKNLSRCGRERYIRGSTTTMPRHSVFIRSHMPTQAPRSIRCRLPALHVLFVHRSAHPSSSPISI